MEYLSQRRDDDLPGREYALLTDLYQLTMDASYLDNKKDRERATFDMFVRKLPADWGYLIANGIDDNIDFVTSLQFQEDDIEYLNELNLFNDEFLDYAKKFRFNGDIYAVRDGTPVANNAPILIAQGNRAEAQYIETATLNEINFQTIIASKASRVVNAAGKASVAEFGLRRGPGKEGSLQAAKACYIAGCTSTSNVMAGKLYRIPVSGTHAHSFVMSFDSEIEAFRAYVRTFPNKATLLIDTYNTLNGAKNAIIVAKELEAKGYRLGAVRIDSGDLEKLSKEVRVILDRSGLQYVKIVASNDLNEYKICSLLQNGAPIDAFGVGTEMITAKPISALSGVYKLAEDNRGPKMKLSEGKRTWPGRKQVYRQEDENGSYLYDALTLADDEVPGRPMLELVVKDGKRVRPRQSLKETREYCLDSVRRLPKEARNVIARPYEIKPSPRLVDLADSLEKKYLSRVNLAEVAL